MGMLWLSIGDYGLIKILFGDIVWVVLGYCVGKRHGQIFDIGIVLFRLCEVVLDDYSGW